MTDWKLFWKKSGPAYWAEYPIIVRRDRKILRKCVKVYGAVTEMRTEHLSVACLVFVSHKRIWLFSSFSGYIYSEIYSNYFSCIFDNPLTPNDDYSGRTAPPTSKYYILYIYSTNIGTEYFKRGIYSSFFSLQNVVCFIILTYLVPVLLTFYIQGVLKLKK